MTLPTPPAARPSVEQLAILTVYVVRDDADLALLRLQLERIHRHTHENHTIYAATNRTTPAALAVLENAPNVVCCEIAPTELRGSREHAYYLDVLAARALQDGASHLISLDLDAFPIDDRWVEYFAARGSESPGVAAILRAENGDVVLPHPSCALFRREFFVPDAPSFSPDSDMTPEFRRFLRTTHQAGDTGIRIAYRLWSQQLPWGRVLRSNVRDLHPLIAGIYGDVVFHLGAGARASLFRRDLETSLAHRLTRPIELARPRRASTRQLKSRVLARFRSPSERRIIERNQRIADEVREWLFRDADGLIAHLRGHDPASTNPDPQPSSDDRAGPD